MNESIERDDHRLLHGIVPATIILANAFCDVDDVNQFLVGQVSY